MFGDIVQKSGGEEENVRILTEEDFEKEDDVDLDTSLASFMEKEGLSEEL